MSVKEKNRMMGREVKRRKVKHKRNIWNGRRNLKKDAKRGKIKEKGTDCQQGKEIMGKGVVKKGN